jgi:long-chain-fatty-acid---luciferin-component ligase
VSAATGSVAAATARRVRPPDLGSLEELLYEGIDSYAQPPKHERRVEWIAAAADHHIATNPLFKRLADHQGFSPRQLRSTGDLSSVPLISSGLFKRRDVMGAADTPVRLCRSSSTRGSQSVVPRDRPTMERFVGTVLHGLREFHGHSEVRQALVLSPSATEAGDLWFAYVLTLVELLYDTRFFVRDGELRPEDLHSALCELDDDAQPTLVSSPGLLVDYLAWMQERSLSLDLGAREGYVVTAGGWKRREQDAVNREDLTATIQTRLGLAPDRVRDALNMVELNTVMFECECARKHVPPWLAVSALRPSDLSTADCGETGVLAYLDPTATSYPSFILSDDLGATSEGRCPCGRHGTTVQLERRLATIEERGCGLKLDRYGRSR